MSHRSRSTLARAALVTAVVAAAGLTTPRDAQAQDPSLADSLAMMQEFMGPMMGNMMASMLDGMLTTLARPESAEKLATFTRNYYEALIRKGFTEEQALRLVAAVGFPSLGWGT